MSSKKLFGYQKTQDLVMISNPFKKLQKNSCEKVINEKVTEKFSFDFY